MQLAANLSERRAAEAARSPIDWKYRLGLDCANPGFGASVASEFRSCLVAGHAETLLLDPLLAPCRERRLLVARGWPRTDGTHGLGAVRRLDRLGCVTEALRAALDALAVAAPGWLRAHAEESRGERDAKPTDDPYVPQGEAVRRAHVEQIGRVGVQNIRIVPVDDGTGTKDDADHTKPQTTRVVWRTSAEGITPSLVMIVSPSDPLAHAASARGTRRAGGGTRERSTGPSPSRAAGGRASKGRCRWTCGPCICDAPATSGWPRPPATRADRRRPQHRPDHRSAGG